MEQYKLKLFPTVTIRNNIWKWILSVLVVLSLSILYYAYIWTPVHEARKQTKWSLQMTNEVLYAVLSPYNHIVTSSLTTISRSIQIKDKPTICLLVKECGVNRGKDLWEYAPYHWTYNKTVLLKLVCQTQEVSFVIQQHNLVPYADAKELCDLPFLPRQPLHSSVSKSLYELIDSIVASNQLTWVPTKAMD